jgi:hypothetical protein
MSEQKPVDTPYVYTWDDQNRLRDLEHLYQDTRRKVQDNIAWYTRNAKGKKMWAQPLRIPEAAFITRCLA